MNGPKVPRSYWDVFDDDLLAAWQMGSRVVGENITSACSWNMAEFWDNLGNLVLYDLWLSSLVMSRECVSNHFKPMSTVYAGGIGWSFFQVEHCCPTLWCHPGSLWAPSHWYVFLHGGCGGLRDLFPGSSQWTGLHFWILGWNCGTNTLWHHGNGKIFGWGTSIFIQRPWTCAALGRNLHDLAALLCLTLCIFLKEVVIGSGPGEMKSLAQLFLVRPWVSWFCWLQLVETLGNRQLTLYRRIPFVVWFSRFLLG